MGELAHRADDGLTGRTALVTGGARGIGRAIAEALACAGVEVAITGRDEARIQQAAREIASLPGAGAVHGLVMEVGDADSIRAGFAALRERMPRLDILVNNAGEAASAPFHRTDEALWQRMLQVNLTGAWHCIREALPPMLKADYGRIINVASTAGLIGYAYVSAYVAAKHGLVGLTRSLALETAKTAVTVNAICPGYTETDIVRDAVANIVSKTGKGEADALASLTGVNPQGRLVQPAEIARCVLWLCSPEARSITGQSIPIAGGEVMTR
jgi:NAD(P)-dependent dehydrogenase (short-subunit alcohol dehydrogenase family)